MSREWTVENSSNLVNAAQDQRIEQQNNYFGTQPNVHEAVNRYLFTVPGFLLDDNFVGHRTLVRNVSENVKSSNKCALHGLHGIGTSRVAAEVAKRVHRDPFDSVFWFDAANVTSFLTGMESTADALSLIQKRKKTGETSTSTLYANVVKIWMESDQSGSWLLILDAADREATSSNPNRINDDESSHFLHHLPRCSTTPLRTILITTGNREIAGNWCLPNRPFEVPFLERPDAISLLRTMSGDRGSPEQDAEYLVEELDRNPSAILTAAKVIWNLSEEGGSISTFLASFRKTKGRSFVKKICKGNADGVLCRNTVSLTAAWCRSIEEVQRSTRATNLLYLAACFDATRISRDLFRNAFTWDDEALRVATTKLRNYRLIYQSPESRDYCMPRLVRATVRNWIDQLPQESETVPTLLKWHLKALQSLLATYDRLAPLNGQSLIKAQAERRSLLPHAAMFQQFCRIRKCTTRLREDHFRAIVVFAELFTLEGRYQSAIDMLGFAMESNVPDSTWRNIALLRLAENLRNQTLVDGQSSRLDKALDIIHDVRRAPNDVVARDLDSTFALIYTDQKEFKKATHYQAAVVRSCRQEFGSRDPETLDACLEYSTIRRRDGHQKEALKEQKRIEGLLQEPLLSDEPGSALRLLRTRAAMVRTYYSLNMLTKAVDLARKVAKGREDILGASDMKTIGSQRDLAECLLDQGTETSVTEAIEIYEDIEKKLREMFEPDHQEVLACIAKLNSIRTGGGFVDAEAMEA
ncbi:hypothetical protein FB567DRAFT_602483 [Paraphoma chrysanthemicola]|uniref:NB-ARC domain-containing protein n=1 Tax=Paraphoma chrysanthemicola TaxID=798071 RepID=A0A8K0VXP6_9PLEO|nr:hypothetical protein FB567DRAFT_602483 [Paraphoma chrysanthemicola]